VIYSVEGLCFEGKSKLFFILLLVAELSQQKKEYCKRDRKDGQANNWKKEWREKNLIEWWLRKKFVLLPLALKKVKSSFERSHWKVSYEEGKYSKKLNLPIFYEKWKLLVQEREQQLFELIFMRFLLFNSLRIFQTYFKFSRLGH
jgi:hypothetical protein